MPYSHLDDYPADVRQRAAGIRVAAFDVDGTLSDGTLWYGAHGEQLKAFHVHDGLGMKLLREHGIEVALVTARESAVVEARARELGLRYVFQGARDKRGTVEHLLHALELEFGQLAFMGDDLPDLPVLRLAGLAIAPANAHPWIRERVHWRTRAAGGHGAVREAADLLLAAQGHAEAVLSRYAGP